MPRPQENSGGSNNILADLIEAAVTQAINSSTDEAHSVSREVNFMLFTTKIRGYFTGRIIRSSKKKSSKGGSLEIQGTGYPDGLGNSCKSRLFFLEKARSGTMVISR